MDLGEIKKIIENDCLYGPGDVKYDHESVWIGGIKMICERPRLVFCEVLSWWDEPTPERAVIAGAGVSIGAHCTIGGSGFGYEYDEDGRLIRMPHHGNLIIGDNVTIHNQVNIDRAVLGSTIIGDGTKIDSLVHISHGVKVGKHCLIVSGVVIGGQAEIGDYSFIGMNASIKQKVKVGRNCVVGAGAVVISDMPDNTVYVGNPAKYLKMTESREYPCAE
jgi:UDP-3-O-[3-hydroxymyristoyl] glucosamine N-acyltransferase